MTRSSYVIKRMLSIRRLHDRANPHKNNEVRECQNRRCQHHRDTGIDEMADYLIANLLGHFECPKLSMIHCINPVLIVA